jgi:hypothetical protein
MAGSAEPVSSWIENAAPEQIPDDLLGRVMLVGTPTTMPDLSVVSDIPAGPQAHVAIQGGATAPIGTHFHGVDQFQVFVRGSGTVGRHQVGQGTVHYADRHTVYGPLRAGPAGMAYLTLRSAHDTGASFMPASSRKLAEVLEASDRSAGDRRNLAVDLQAPSGTGSWVDLVAHDDGLRISVSAPGPDEAIKTILARRGGAYALVLAGSLVCDEGGGAPTGSLRWLPPGTGIEGHGGPAGARLVVLQFPA